MEPVVGVLSEIISLENMDPTVTVDQNDGHSFKRSVNFTGTAHDILGLEFMLQMNWHSGTNKVW